jgi:hypothetical protein
MEIRESNTWVDVENFQSILETGRKWDNVVNSNLAQDEVHSIQHYVIKFVSDLQQVGGFLPILRFPPPIKLTAMI